MCIRIASMCVISGNTQEGRRVIYCIRCSRHCQSVYFGLNLKALQQSFCINCHGVTTGESVLTLTTPPHAHPLCDLHTDRYKLATHRDRTTLIWSVAGQTIMEQAMMGVPSPSSTISYDGRRKTNTAIHIVRKQQLHNKM